ncbi:MAG: hypothetical protein AAFO07_03705 [Bacteroidota bacterium]
MNKFLVRFIGLFNPLWRNLGANTTHLKYILETKLMMDGRRPTAIGSHYRTSGKKQTTAQDVVLIVVGAFMGLSFGVILFVAKPFSLGLCIYFFAWMIFMAMMIISDFTDVLIDPKDNYIIFPRPVNDATVTLSRVLHIGLYLSKLVIATTLPAIIIIPFRVGILGTLLFIVLVVLALLMVIFLVNLVYLLILRVTTPNAFKEVINYFQILFTVFIFAGYYLFPRLIDFDIVKEIDVFSTFWGPFSPSSWLAGLWELVMLQRTEPVVLFCAGLAIFVPLIGMYLVVKVLADQFSQKLFLASNADSKKPISTQKKVKNKGGVRAFWSNLLCKTKLEKASFDLVWQITARSREFKLKTYPGFAYLPVAMMSFMLIGDEGSVVDRIQNADFGEIIFAYLGLFVILGPLNVSNYSEMNKAAWTYHASPVALPGDILVGRFKALMTKFYIPIFIISVLISIAIWGFRVLDDFALGFVFNLWLAALTSDLDKYRLPFSLPMADMAKGGNLSQGLVSMFVVSFVGFGHYFLLKDRWYIILPISLALAVNLHFLLKKKRLTPWKKISTS